MSYFFYESFFLSQGLSKEQKKSTYWFLREYAFRQTPEIVLINNLGFKVLIVNSGAKSDFKYEKRH